MGRCQRIGQAWARTSACTPRRPRTATAIMTMNARGDEVVAFTICSRKHFAYALTLHEAFTRHHSEVRFYVALCERDDGFAAATYPFTLLRLAELGLPETEAMA